MSAEKETPKRVMMMIEKELEKNPVISKFCLKLGINSESLRNYRAGKREPTLATLEKMAQYWGVTVPWLLGFTDDARADLQTATKAEDLVFHMIYDKVILLSPKQALQVLSLADKLLKENE